MKIISIISQKGGAGKTTIAVNLAVASILKKKMAGIIDLDPQASAFGWGGNRDNEDPVVVAAQTVSLPDILDRAEEAGADLMIIDTSPHSQNAALEAARVSDFVLVPCRPAILDLRAIGSTIDIAKLAQKRVGVVLNAVPARGSLNEQARMAIKAYGVEIAPVELGQRMAYAHAMTDSLGVQEYEPKGKSAQEIKKLYPWIWKQLNN